MTEAKKRPGRRECTWPPGSWQAMLSEGLRKAFKRLAKACGNGTHSFSWREAGQPCPYCGEPPRSAAKP